LVVFATIGESPFAGITLTAVEVRLYAATVTDLQMLHTFTDLSNLNPQFMTRNAWECEKGKFSQIAPDVRATNTDTVNPHEGLVRPDGGGRGDVK
jgi:hypothetical protein